MGEDVRRIESPGDAPTLRAVAPEDAGFQFALFCARRGGPLRLAGIPAPVIESLMCVQFRARALSYGQAHPGARWWIVESSGAPVGELVLDARADRLHIVDITLAPERQRRGLGPAVLRAVMDELVPPAEVSALIDIGNAPSRRMFTRLGFVQRAYDDAHVEALWRKQ